MSPSPPVKSRDAVGAHHVEGIPHDVVADGFSDTMTNFFGDIDVWYRQKACPLIIRVLPAWCTANMVTTGNLTTAAVCISAALFVDNDPDHFWRSSFLQLVVMCTAVGYSFIDVLVRAVGIKVACNVVLWVLFTGAASAGVLNGVVLGSCGRRTARWHASVATALDLAGRSITSVTAWLRRSRPER